ncbi:probable polygalacturonase At1g80170 isoform X2 [Phalaenopsis equestris]|uniref:probable polygalacturonase At1g80170 isoform X2 n=1 Tax=Phalaenopsis equestris TaxID=78828 RepID=UPI0009E1F587|nr:probable polygalacturonase At1g80170 isoform X2 [Phalaenopsis equestris]
MGLKSWLITLPLVLITMPAVVRAQGTDFDAEQRFSSGIQLWGGEEDEELKPLSASEFPVWRSSGAEKKVVNVESFGAVGDGIADDTQAFASAWKKACFLSNAVFLVPEKRVYKVNVTKFRGPCQNKLIIQIAGTIVAPEEPRNWDPKNPRVWLVFSNLEGVRIQGGGIIDGSGSKWWASSCKINKTNALTIDSSSKIRVKGLGIQSAQQMHFTISRSAAIRISGVRVKSPPDSPNTDGIHISESTDVSIQNCHIGTGDDCISIVNASSNIKMKNIDCGPGHGISIGSLGKDNSVGIVTGIVLDTAKLTGTTNGLRIKTWQGGSGYVRSVRFENVKMDNVENPIIIDQFYCDSPKVCKNKTEAVKISQVMYKNISGTSRTSKAMKFACSDTVPCSNIVLNNINLERENGTAETYCNCAMGFDYGFVRPAADCLRNDVSSGCNGGSLNNNKKHVEINTEL